MAIILLHGVLFRGGAEARIRRKLLEDGHIDTVIGLPANLYLFTGTPVCILGLKKYEKPDDVLIINAENRGRRPGGPARHAVLRLMAHSSRLKTRAAPARATPSSGSKLTAHR